MTQGAAHGAWPAKPDSTKATVSSPGAVVARPNVATAQGAPKTGPKPVAPAAPIAPKLQAAPAATPVTKPVVPPPLPSGHRLIPSAPERAEDEPTRVAPAPVAEHKPTASPSPTATAQVRPHQPQAAALLYPEPREDMRPIVRSMVEQAMAPYDRKFREMQRRLEELENRQAPVPVVVAAPALAPVSFAARPYLAPSSSQAAGRALDVAAIERSVKLGPEMEVFDGRRRRLRLALAVAFACVVVFGGLFAALAQSYTHAHG